jgi:hypothetical protein
MAMDTETLKTIASIGGPMVATASLVVNVFQAWLLRTRTPTAFRVQDVRDALRTIVGQFDSSSVFTVAPHIEVWDRGFKSLALIRETLATSNTVIQHAKPNLVQTNIKNIVRNILVEVQNVYSFNDSFIPIQRGREYVPFDEILKWEQNSAAMSALTALQSYVRQNRPALEEFLSSL